ncbi:MAG: hypothetical protein ABSC19_01270 [Syntrophorhabdales bacterium]|jgi:hypothetical protein
MRIVSAIVAAILIVAGASAPAFALGLYVERLQDLNENICPVCHRVIVPGDIHENAETTLMTEFGGALEEKGIKYTQEKGEAQYLNVLIYRFQERRGGNFAVERPASVGFHVHLFDQSGLARVIVFDETQQPLSDNIFRFFTFLRRKARWITASELAREGVRKAVDDLADDLKQEGAAKRP